MPHRGKALPEDPRLYLYERIEKSEGRLRSTRGVGESWQAHGGPIVPFARPDAETRFGLTSKDLAPQQGFDI